MKTALVTGASRGIGRASAIMLASRGYAVAVNYYRNKASAEEVCSVIRSAGGVAGAYRADISREEDVIKMKADISADLGTVEVLVNNAGIAEQKMFCDISEKDWERIFDTDTKGAYLVTKAFLPDMIHEKHGRIINISSVWGITGGSCEVHYSAAKAALIGMTKALAKELGPSGITVNCVAPGVIDTDMNNIHSREVLDSLAKETPLGCIGTPEDVAGAVCFFASEEASFITGQVLSVDGGICI